MDNDDFIKAKMLYSLARKRKWGESRTAYSTKLSHKLSKDLKKRGMNFVGPGIIYAFVQAIGMVSDHEMGCSDINK